MSDLKITEDKVREEHLAEVRPSLQWAYLAGVVGGAFLLMVGLIALLGTTV